MGDNKATLSVHSLDTSSGRPANNLPFVLSVSEGDEWKTLSEHITNDGSLFLCFPSLPLLFSSHLPLSSSLDGRAKMNPLEVGFTYRIRFDTTTYFKTHNVEVCCSSQGKICVSGSLPLFPSFLEIFLPLC